MSITINGQPLNDHLEDEKVKELKVEIHVHHNIYRRPDSRVTTKGKSSKVKVVDNQEDIFMHFVDSIDQDIAYKFIDGKVSEQGKVWRAWKKTSICSTEEGENKLEKLITQLVGG